MHISTHAVAVALQRHNFCYPSQMALELIPGERGPLLRPAESDAIGWHAGRCGFCLTSVGFFIRLWP